VLSDNADIAITHHKTRIQAACLELNECPFICAPPLSSFERVPIT
jgi:hypothetical protein